MCMKTQMVSIRNTEIFAHIGTPKKAQNNKVTNDILKMLLLKKREFRKIIVVCDEDELKKLTGNSVLAESISEFDIEIIYVKLSEELREAIIATQIRKNMVNA